MICVVPTVGIDSCAALTLNLTFLPFFRPLRLTVAEVGPVLSVARTLLTLALPFFSRVASDALHFLAPRPLATVY